MNAHDPPKEKGALLHAASSKPTSRLAEDRSGFCVAQVCPHTDTFIGRRNVVRIAGIIRSREQILREIRSLRVMQAPVGRIFWGLEQRIAGLADEIERRGS
jgi:hypothetical protein